MLPPVRSRNPRGSKGVEAITLIAASALAIICADLPTAGGHSKPRVDRELKSVSVTNRSDTPGSSLSLNPHAFLE
jgi:hypothetical protein